MIGGNKMNGRDEYLLAKYNIYRHISAPIHVDLEITSACPYRCIFCESDIPNRRIKSLDTKKYIYILDKLAEAGVFRVFLTGGEPLANPDFPTIYKYAKDIGLAPCVSSNLYLLNSKLLEKLMDAGLDHIQVSIHGPSYIHDLIVKRPGSYEKVLKNLEQIKSTGIYVEVACVGIRQNFAYIPQLINDIAPTEIDLFRVLRYVPGHRRNMLNEIPPKYLVLETIPKIFEAAKKNNLEVFIGVPPGLDSPFNLPPEIYEVIHLLNHFCEAGKYKMTILPNGDVYPCTLFRNKKEMYCGNILEKEIHEIWNALPMRKLREITPENYKGKCYHCPEKWHCYSCRCVAYNLTGILEGEDQTCYKISQISF